VALLVPPGDTKELTSRYVVNARRFGQAIRPTCIYKENYGKKTMKGYKNDSIAGFSETFTRKMDKRKRHRVRR